MERQLLKIHDYKDIGEVKIADSVIEVIASIATLEVDGVKQMVGTATEGIVEKFGKKNHSKGVKVTVEGNEVKLLLSIVVEFGVNIKELTETITDKVTNTVETMTGLQVVEVNINVEGVL